MTAFIPLDASDNTGNIALNKNVSASTSGWSDSFWSKDSINDGTKMKAYNPVTGESLGWNGGYFATRDQEIWIQIDLENLYTIDKIIIYPRNANDTAVCFPEDYEILAATDGETWTSIKKVTGDTNTSLTAREFTFETTKAAQIRIKVTKLASNKDGAQYSCQISEIEVFGEAVLPDLGDANLALNKPVDVSGAYIDAVWNPIFLTDGYKMDSWPLPEGKTLGWACFSDTRDVEMTARIDLQSIYNVDKVYIYPRGNGGICFPDNYLVQISTDNENWTTVKEVVGDTAVEEKGRLFEFNSVKARYIRLYITYLSAEMDGRYACEISEICVYGDNTNEMSLNKSEVWMNIGETQKISCNFLYPIENPNLTYSIVSGDDVVDISNGILTAKAIGEATMEVTEEQTNLTKTCKIKVLVKKEKNIIISVPVWANDDFMTEEQFRWIREADIDAVMAVGPETNKQYTDKMLQTARNIWDDALPNNLGTFIYSRACGITINSSDKDIQEYVDAYKNSPTLLGYHLDDEPFETNPYARLHNFINENDKNTISDLNFLPGFVYSSYDEYYNRLSDYAKLTKGSGGYLSFDNYPFGIENGSVDEYTMYKNFDAVRRSGLDNDTDTAFYALSVGSDHFGYRRPDIGTFRYHCSAAMAYGFKWIKYFSWFTPGSTDSAEMNWYTDGVISKTGEKTQMYEQVKTVNKQIHNVGTTLAMSDALQIYHCGNASTASSYNKIPANFFVQPIGDHYAIISLLKHRETGSEYIMIVNKNMLSSKSMSFRMDGIISLEELDKNNKDTTFNVTLNNGVLTRNFLPGEFALYKLPDDRDFINVEVPTSSNLLKNAKSTASGSVGNNGWFINCINDNINFSQTNSMGWQISNHTSKDEWILFDLGEPKEFNRFDLYPAFSKTSSGNLFPNNISLYASNDGVDYSLIFTQEKIANPTTDVPVYRFQNTTARFVKAVFKDVEKLAVSEMELFNDDGAIELPPKTSYEPVKEQPFVNIARGKSVTVGSEYRDSVWNKNNLTDGIKSMDWPMSYEGATLGWLTQLSQSRNVSETAQIDLGASFPINQIDIYPRGNGGVNFPEDYSVEISNNGFGWTKIADVVGDIQRGVIKRSFSFEKQYVKNIRVNITKHSQDMDGSNYVSAISEIEALYIPDIYVSYSNGENEIGMFKKEKIYAKILSKEKTFKAISCLYKGNKLLDAKIVDTEDTVLLFDLTTTEYVDGLKIRTYIWEDMINMKPISSPYEISGTSLYSVNFENEQIVFSDNFDGKTATQIYEKWGGVHNNTVATPVENGELKAVWDTVNGVGYYLKQEFLNVKYDFDIRCEEIGSYHSYISLRTNNNAGQMYNSFDEGSSEKGFGIGFFLKKSGTVGINIVVADCEPDILSELPVYHIKNTEQINFNESKHITIYDLDDRILFLVDNKIYAAIVFEELEGDFYNKGSVYDTYGNLIGRFTKKVYRKSNFGFAERTINTFMDNFKVYSNI